MILLIHMHVNILFTMWMDEQYALYCPQPTVILNCSSSGILISAKYFVIISYFDQTSDLKVEGADFQICKLAVGFIGFGMATLV